MDVLTDALAALRTGRPLSSRVRMHTPWSLDFPPVKGAGFHVVLQGSCRLIPAEGAPILLGPGDVAFLHRGHGHSLAGHPDASLPAHAPGDRAQDNTTVLLCGSYQLDHNRPHPLFRDLPEVVHLPARVGRHRSLGAAVDLLGSELDENRPGIDAVVAALVDILLLYILRAWFDEQAGSATTGWVAALNDPAIAAALEAIHTDPATPWTVDELGRRVGMSRAVFARRFADLVGEPPLTYLTRWRLRTAAQLLRQSDLPLQAVSQRVGYTSQFAFAKSFKREYGTSPGRYRRSATPAGDSFTT